MSKRKEYSFSKEIENKLSGFKTYLQQLGNGKDTIRQKMNYAGYFLTWLESEHLSPQETRYNDLLSFIDYCKLEEKSKKHINSKLRSIRNFYEYLKKQNPNIVNPALNLHLKGIKQKLPSGIIRFDKLENLYQTFPPEVGQVPQPTDRDKRNKVILGLLIYQGITTEELHQLEVTHLKLKKGKIYIPGSRRRNSRTLTLKPFQILDLYEYEIKVRPKLIKQETRQLFVSMEGNRQLKNSLHHLFRKIRKIHPLVISPKQIRASVITHWLKDHNLRQVQYMAGHKYVSSTERYQLNNLDKLQSRLEKYHPLNKTINEY